MKLIAIDFNGVAAAQRRGQLLCALGAIAFLTAGLCCLWLPRQEAAARQLLDKTANMDLPKRAKSAATSGDTALMDQMAGSALEITIPWDELYTAIEHARTDTIIVAEIRPDANRRIVDIAGGATSYQEAIGFVERLRRRHPLTSVNLSSHKTETSEPQYPVRFIITANWAGA